MPYPISDHCDGRRFFNPRYHVDRGWEQVLRWKLTSRGALWPSWVDVAPRPLPPLPRDASFAMTWVNHATVVVRVPGFNLVVDPVWSDRVGLFSRLGPRRVHLPGVRFEDLPKIDAILLTHDHYDHCDLGTLRRLHERFPDARFIAPLGNGSLAARAGFGAAHRVEMEWWDSLDLSPTLTLHCTPARHWSNRVSGSRNGRLWGGYFLNANGRSLYIAGDTAYDPVMMGEIRAKLGSPDLAVFPIGAYEPRWFMRDMHCNPAEAVEMHRLLEAGISVGLHWGTFRLSDEGREEPRTELAKAVAAARPPFVDFRTLGIGETIAI